MEAGTWQTWPHPWGAGRGPGPTGVREGTRRGGRVWSGRTLEEKAASEGLQAGVGRGGQDLGAGCGAPDIEGL